MHWNQISFEVNNQQSDLVSEVLMGLGSISISYSDGQDNAIFEPPVGETPLWESIQVKALFQSEVDINLVADTLSEGCNIKIIDSLKVEDKIWEEECQKDFPSMQFGKNLWVCPSWSSKNPSSEAAIVINMDPGLAFGTGTHQTTSLCLEFLDENPPIGLTAIDFGCGTGILAIAAAKLGAIRVTAIDNDPQAVTSSSENVKKNGPLYFPMLFTIFTFIFFCNLMGMVPFSFTVTSHIVVTLGLAMMAFLAINIIGIKTHKNLREIKNPDVMSE